MRERRFDRFVRIAAHAGDEENARAGELADGPFADAAADDAVDLIVNEGTDLGAVTGAADSMKKVLTTRFSSMS